MVPSSRAVPGRSENEEYAGCVDEETGALIFVLSRKICLHLWTSIHSANMKGLI